MHACTYIASDTLIFGVTKLSLQKWQIKSNKVREGEKWVSELWISKLVEGEIKGKQLVYTNTGPANFFLRPEIG